MQPKKPVKKKNSGLRIRLEVKRLVSESAGSTPGAELIP
jgi:hypothetical protein